jgi:hypothetical protein
MRTNSGVRDTSALALFLLPFGRPGRHLVRDGGRLGLAGRFFCVAAHDLLDADRERAPLLGAHQGQREEGQPGNRLAIQTGKEPIQAIGVGAGFGGHDLVAHQEVDIVWTVNMLTKEHPKQDGPGEGLGEKALDSTVTAAFAGPAGEAQHRDPSCHHEHSPHNSAELATGGRCHMGLEAVAKC